jgi:hypothetical protein
MNKAIGCLVVAVSITACGPTSRGGGGGGGGGADIDAFASGGGGGGGGSGSGSGAPQSYLVHAHSDHVLYTIELTSKTLVTVGNFNTPNAPNSTSPDVITDLAVAPDGTIYVISKTELYTASAQDGHVTQVGSLSTCGTSGVALTTTSDGRLWMGDYMGAICQIDISVNPPVVRAPVMMQGGYALSGDMVGIGNGTVFGSAYKPNDSSTQNNNVLVTVDVTTGAVTQMGATGYPKLFGVAFQDNQVFGFTHDGTGRVVTIDTTTGHGTMFGTFTDPATSRGISFAGAGVNSQIVIQ